MAFARGLRVEINWRATSLSGVFPVRKMTLFIRKDTAENLYKQDTVIVLIEAVTSKVPNN